MFLFLIIFIIGVWLTVCLFQTNQVYDFLINFIISPGLEFSFSLYIDFYGAVFATSVSLISIRVIGFAESYMANSVYNFRFLLILLSFVASMYILIFRSNLIFLILGWDGLGVSSYFLVRFFISRRSYNAGIITVLTNRLGDILLLTIIGLLILQGSWSTIQLTRLLYENYLESFIFLLVIVALFTKRAQTPFSAWLPAAMAAPTPVSSLVHSSTLVTAGVYLGFRWFPSNLNIFCLSLGLITLLIAGITALREHDIKKIVALSTLRQLGLMVFCLGLGFKERAFFHLLIHAYFKALLFISVGNIIHLSDDYQDMRKIRSRENPQRITLVLALFANFRLIGIPFIRGFYSKDLALESILFLNNSFYIWGIIFVFGCILTTRYSLRACVLTMWGKKKSKCVETKFIEDGRFILGGLSLWILRVRGGRVLGWLIFESRSLIFNLELKILILSIICLGCFCYLIINEFQDKKKNYFKWGPLGIWRLPFWSGRTIKFSTFKLAYFGLYNLDGLILSHGKKINYELFSRKITMKEVTHQKEFFSVFFLIIIFSLTLIAI